MKEDAELLRDYAANRSEAAFTELVRRHIGMVYSAAFRQVNGDAHLAEDIAQLVFIDLSRKSARLARHTSLTGWLYTSVRYAAGTARRANQRRQQRECEAQAMNEPIQNQPVDTNWEMLRPILDEALHALGKEDRLAILLRFLEGKTLAEVGRGLGLNENAARKRVERALEKLRHFFARRGITVSAMVLAEALNSETMAAIPPSLAAAVTAASLAATPASLPLLTFMAITKSQIGAVAVAAAMTTAIIVQFQANAKLRQQNEVLRQQTAQMDALRAENERLAQSRAVASQSPPLGQDQLRELARLRGEAGRLRSQLAEAAKSQRADKERPAEQPQAEPEDASLEHQLAMVRLNSAKWLMLPMLEYAEEHQGVFPTNFGQITEKLKGINMLSNQFEVLYQGNQNDITNPANTVVVRETQGQQMSTGNWTRAYGFADGHSELHNAADGNFGPWEQQHIQTPPAQ